MLKVTIVIPTYDKMHVTMVALAISTVKIKQIPFIVSEDKIDPSVEP